MPTIPEKVNNYTCIFSKNMLLYILLVWGRVGPFSERNIFF